MNSSRRYQLVIVAPVYDDAAAAQLLLGHLGNAFAEADLDWRVLFVDDGSPEPLAQQLQSPEGLPVEVLRLKRNVGHQRAIALGAAYVHENLPCDAMLVMDADGEDLPSDALRLVRQCQARNGQSIIFAERARRSESWLFQFCYRAYQWLHWWLTGIPVRVGNFSVVPYGRLGALVTMPALWNHYAAAIFHGRLPREHISTVRGTRYSGQSKMNFVALVIHGLQAISVFIEVVTVRLLLAVCVLVNAFVAALVFALVAPGWLGLEIPRWVPYSLGAAVVATLSLAFGSLSLTLGFLANRNNVDFLPSRDYGLFVLGVDRVSSAAEAKADGVMLNVFPTWEERLNRAS